MEAGDLLSYALCDQSKHAKGQPRGVEIDPHHSMSGMAKDL